MEHSMYITFKLRKSKINKNGLAPINMKITVDRQRTELSTNRSLSPSLWNETIGYASGKSDEEIILNNYLTSLKTKVQRQFNILESLGKEITVEAIKNRLNGQTEKKYTLINIFNYHNEEMKKSVQGNCLSCFCNHFTKYIHIIPYFCSH
jgi:hypothetical protein